MIYRMSETAILGIAGIIGTLVGVWIGSAPPAGAMLNALMESSASQSASRYRSVRLVRRRLATCPGDTGAVWTRAKTGASKSRNQSRPSPAAGAVGSLPAAIHSQHFNRNT